MLPPHQRILGPLVGTWSAPSGGVNITHESRWVWAEYMGTLRFLVTGSPSSSTAGSAFFRPRLAGVVGDPSPAFLPRPRLGVTVGFSYVSCQRI